MPASVRLVCGHLQGPLLKAALRAARHDDAGFVDDLRGKFPAIGRIPPSGTWTPRAGQPADELSDLLQAARERQGAGR
eukprot:5700126-Pyramimonas_sp.AAC.1